MNVQRVVRLVSIGCILMLVPVVAWAQASSGAISGVVRDASSGVLPGVTVEASSPALIERVRTAVTDSQGLFQIVDLRPGVYTVSFTLPGFSTLRREGVDLGAGFTATVNAELRVGGLEETITVTGEAPVVDTRNIRMQSTLRRDVLDALPTTRRIAQLVTMIPGATTGNPANHSVGGAGIDRGEFAVNGQRGTDYGVQRRRHRLPHLERRRLPVQRAHVPGTGRRDPRRIGGGDDRGGCRSTSSHAMAATSSRGRPAARSPARSWSSVT